MIAITQYDPAAPALFTKAIFMRSAVVAVIVGSVLTLLNQGNAIFGDEGLKIVPMVVACQTPFLVVTVSHIIGKRLAE